MSLFKSELSVKTTMSVLTFFIGCDKDGDLNLDPSYQRNYEWDEVAAQSLFHTVFNTLPLGSVSVALDSTASQYCEVVDGKQRITTLLKFYKNEIPVYRSKTTGLVVLPELIDDEDSEEFYFKEMSPVDQREFKKLKIPSVELTTNENKPLSEIDKMKYFHRVNFAGIPISPEHKLRVEEMINQESRK